MLITQERLKELLHYDPETGVFTRKVRTSARVRIGDASGATDSKGHRQISVGGKRYLAHRLAWLYVNGVWPRHQVDHINGARSDNRITNLREANVSQNQQNQRKPRSDSTSGYLGVSFNNQRGKWRAQIRVRGKVRHIGLFNCPTAAYLLGYLPAKRSLHEFNTL